MCSLVHINPAHIRQPCDGNSDFLHQVSLLMPVTFSGHFEREEP